MKAKSADSPYLGPDPRPDRHEVTEELAKILASEEFVTAHRLRSFLRYIVEEALAGRSEGLKAYTIALGAFDRDETFDPQLDPIVRIQAGRLRRSLEQYYREGGALNPVRIMVPKGRYIPIFSNSALTVSKGQEVSKGQDYGAANAREPLPESRESQSFAAPPSIGLVIFADGSPGDENAHVATGITSQLLVNFTRFRSFTIRGPISPGKFEASEDIPTAIGRKLGICFVLTGEVQVLEKRLRVSVTLTRTLNGDTVWGNTYDRTLNAANLLEVEDEIAEKTAAAVCGGSGIVNKVNFRASLAKRRAEFSAYDAVLRSYHWGVTMTAEAFSNALEALEDATKKYPLTALPKALLADLYCVDHFCELGIVDEALVKAGRLIQEAAHLDPDCQDAQWILGQVYFYHGRFNASLQAFESALALNSRNPHALAACGFYLPSLGDWDRGMELTKQAMDLSPHFPRWYHTVPILYHLREGELEAATYHANRYNVPGLFWGPALRAAVFARAGLAREAEKRVDELLTLYPGFASNGRILMKRYLREDENVELVAGGLESAGLVLQ